MHSCMATATAVSGTEWARIAETLRCDRRRSRKSSLRRWSRARKSAIIRHHGHPGSGLERPRLHRLACARRVAAIGGVRSRRRARPQRVGAAIALFRVARLQCAGGRLAGARALGGRAASRRSRRLPTGSTRCSTPPAIERASLVGHSMGSLAVLECAARHAARVERVALLGPAVPMAVSDALLDAARDDEHSRTT